MLQYRLTNDAIASIYEISLPKEHDLPPGYPSVRSWLSNRVRTLEGKNKECWRRTKADPERLQQVREQNKVRALRYREKKQQLEA
jgi:hypothetical protein